jgi:hypothetical protein
MEKKKNPIGDMVANLVNPSAQSTSDSLHLAEVNQVPLVDLAKMQKIANKVVEAEGDIDLGMSKINQAVSVVAEMLGTEPSYDWWEAIRNAYQASYKVCRPKIDDDGLESAWKRIADKLVLLYSLKKPTSPKKGSVAVSESRQKKLDGVKRLTDDQIQKAIAGFKEVENFDEAKFYKQEMKRRDELKNAPLIEKRKENQKLISRCIYKVTDDTLIAKIMALIPKTVITEVTQKVE